jgi:hypothetical protein
MSRFLSSLGWLIALPFFEMALVLVRLDHVSGVIEYPDHCICDRLRNLAYPIALLIAFGSPYHRRPNGSAAEIRSTPR